MYMFCGSVCLDENRKWSRGVCICVNSFQGVRGSMTAWNMDDWTCQMCHCLCRSEDPATHL